MSQMHDKDGNPYGKEFLHHKVKGILKDRRNGSFTFNETSLARVREKSLEATRVYQECISISLVEIGYMDWKWILYTNASTPIGKGHESTPQAAFAAAARRLSEFRKEPLFPGGPRF